MKKLIVVISVVLLPSASMAQWAKEKLEQFNILTAKETIVKTWVIEDYQLPGTSAEMQKIMNALVVEMRSNTYLRFTNEGTYEFYSDGELDHGQYELNPDTKEILLTNTIRSRTFKIESINRKQMTLLYRDPTDQTVKMVFVPAPEQ